MKCHLFFSCREKADICNWWRAFFCFSDIQLRLRWCCVDTFNLFNALRSSRNFRHIPRIGVCFPSSSTPGQQAILEGNGNIKYRWLLLTAEWKRNKLSNHGTPCQQYMPPSLLSRGPMSGLSEYLKCLAICGKVLSRCWSDALPSQLFKFSELSGLATW